MGRFVVRRRVASSKPLSPCGHSLPRHAGRRGATRAYDCGTRLGLMRHGACGAQRTSPASPAIERTAKRRPVTRPTRRAESTRGRGADARGTRTVAGLRCMACESIVICGCNSLNKMHTHTPS